MVLGGDSRAGTGQEPHVPGSPSVSPPQVAAVLTLPFDVVKTQRQIELGDSEVHPGEEPGSRQVPGGHPGVPVGVPNPHLLPSPHSHILQAFLHLAADAEDPC